MAAYVLRLRWQDVQRECPALRQEFHRRVRPHPPAAQRELPSTAAPPGPEALRSERPLAQEPPHFFRPPRVCPRAWPR
jgi:hypothetical protein